MAFYESGIFLVTYNVIVSGVKHKAELNVTSLTYRYLFLDKQCHFELQPENGNNIFYRVGYQQIAFAQGEAEGYAILLLTKTIPAFLDAFMKSQDPAQTLPRHGHTVRIFQHYIVFLTEQVL